MENEERLRSSLQSNERAKESGEKSFDVFGFEWLSCLELHGTVWIIPLPKKQEGS